MARCGCSKLEVRLFAEAISAATNQPRDKQQDIIQAAEDSVDAFAAGREAAGFPKLTETFGEAVAKKCVEWLGYQETHSGRQHGAKSKSKGADEFSEDRLALEFINRHGHELRYVAQWGKWLKWTGDHWPIEHTLAVFDLTRKMCREIAARCDKSSTLTKAKTVAAVEMLSRSDRHVAATVEQWDADFWILNTPGAAADLRREPGEDDDAYSPE